MGLRILRSREEMEIYVAAYLMHDDPASELHDLDLGSEEWERCILEEFQKDHLMDQSKMMIKLVDLSLIHI